MCVRMHLITSHVSATGLWFVPFKQMDYIYILFPAMQFVITHGMHPQILMISERLVDMMKRILWIDLSSVSTHVYGSLNHILLRLLKRCVENTVTVWGKCLQFKSVSVLIATNTALNKANQINYVFDATIVAYLWRWYVWMKTDCIN